MRFQYFTLFPICSFFFFRTVWSAGVCTCFCDWGRQVYNRKQIYLIKINKLLKKREKLQELCFFSKRKFKIYCQKEILKNKTYIFIWQKTMLAPHNMSSEDTRYYHLTVIVQIIQCKCYNH